MQGKNEPNKTSELSPLEKMSPTKEKILLTALDMFSTKGYSAVSVRDITKEVGIRESSLYNHFRTKEEILESIYLIFQTRYSQLLPTSDQLDAFLTKTTPEEFLTHGYQLFINLINDEIIGKIWRIMQMEQFRDPRAGEIFLNFIIKETLSFLESAFRKMIQLEYIPPLDPTLLAYEYQYPVFALGSEYCLTNYLGLDTADIEVKLANHVRYFMESVRRN